MPKETRFCEGKKFSRSDKNFHFCWTVCHGLTVVSPKVSVEIPTDVSVL
jgi:hypothetical protein